MEEAGVEAGPEDLGRGRVEALSDGVFAIVVTLLVLEIKVPHVEAHDSLAALAGALWGLLPKFVSWVISFLTVCVIWLNHHRLLRLVGRFDPGLFWWTANLLLWTSFIPFPTALMGDYPGNRLAVSFYGVVMLLMALAFVLLRRRMLAVPGLLHDEGSREALRRGAGYAIVMGPVAYLVGAALAWVSIPAAFACYAAIAASFVSPRAHRR
ncbi:MAG: TMEM175 family protein [Anaeromyxobacteraceae bacterium]|nr:TMEM175 family protein [Anaeromyxobacteraceae bacterium]